METNLHFTIPLTVNEWANLIRERLPATERIQLVGLLTSNESEQEEEPTKAQLMAEMKQAVQELHLVKEGKMKVPTLAEFLHDL